MKKFFKKVGSTLKWLFWEGNLKSLLFWGWFVYLFMFILNGLAVDGIVALHLGEIYGTTLPVAPAYIPMVAATVGTLFCMISISLHEALTSEKGFSFRNLLAGLTPGLIFDLVIIIWRGFI